MKSLSLTTRILSVSLTILISVSCKAAITIVKDITNINGLTNNSVNCIFEAKDHTMWIGTWDGLNAYDGSEIQSFRYSKSNPKSISNNIIRQIIEDNNYLWIATDNGINRIDKRSKSITRYYLQNDRSVPNQEKSFIIAKSINGDIYCLVRGYKLFQYNRAKDEFGVVKMDFANQIKDFIIDKFDHVIFLFNNGKVKSAHRWNLGKGVNYSNLKIINTEGPVGRIYLSEGRLILSNKNILYLLNSNFTIAQSIKLEIHKNVSNVILSNSRMFISFTEGGCIKYNLNSETYEYLNGVSKQLSIFTLYKGSQNILWIGTDGHGLLQLYTYKPLFQTIYTAHPVRCFCENNNHDILVGTKGDGIQILNFKTKKISNLFNENNGLISNSVYSMKKNHLGDIFIGTEGRSVNILYAGTNKLVKLVIPSRYPKFQAVYSIEFSNNDSLLWVGTSGYGLIKMNIIKEYGKYIVKGFRQYVSTNKGSALNNDIVYAIKSTADDKIIWFGTRGGGVNVVDVSNNKLESLEDLNNNILLTNNDVLSLLYDKGTLWIGTSYGLNKLVKNGHTYQLTQYTDNKLVDKTIHGILKDVNNNIWMSTNKGLSIIISNRNKIDNFTSKDGLQNDEFSDGASFKDNKGLLYFGGVSGFSYFNPLSIHLRKFSPRLSLSKLKIYNTLQTTDNRIKNNILKLGYDERFVTLTFISKDFINNENCEYAYRLKNYRNEWVENGNNPNIVFTQLPPGKYNLEVKSTNGDKVFNSNIYRLTIQVGYPWWLNKWAIIIYLIICLILFFIIKSVIKNRIRLGRQILVTQIEKSHEKKLYETKLDFFTNVAHEFFTPLTLIYTPIQYLIDQSWGNTDAHRYLQVIKENAERMQKLITELMKFRSAKTENVILNPERIDISNLIDETSNNFVYVLKENKIDFKIEKQGLLSLYSDHDVLDEIIFNLLSNALKYTPRYGYIYIKVWQETEKEGILNFIIKNSGKGLTKQQMSELFDRHKTFDTPNIGNAASHGIGLNITKNLVGHLGGQINVSSEFGKYVQFSMQIPPLNISTVQMINNSEDKTNNVNNKHDSSESEKEIKDTEVLIIEDETNIRNILKDILSNYKVSEAKDGKEALERMTLNHPAIIISDIIMPNMDGIALIDKLKSDPKTSYIPIIGISAKVSIEDQINAYNHGADAYITKPFYPKQVLSTVENLLSRQALLKDYFNSSLSSIKLKNGIVVRSEDEELIRKMMDFINSNIDDESLTPSSVADYLGISKATLYRKFKEITDKTPSEFIRNMRIESAAKLLKTTKLTVSEITYKVGFSSKSYFYKEFFKKYSVSPKDYRDNETL